MVIVGEQEEKEGTISVRKHGEGDLGMITIEELQFLIEEINKTLKPF